MSFIKLHNVCLDYFFFARKKPFKKTIIKSVLNLFGVKEETFELHRALDGISAQFIPGDRIALIGKNGSGKSSLLRILSGIYYPTAGSVEIQGTISSLLDIGVGLNVDATGYENIMMMGTLHGQTKKQIKAKFEDLEDFTELKDYLKMPVRIYSSGMRLRLAFGLATSMESDILLIDEVIGVGDQSFMEKAQKRLQALIHKSQILVLSSHSPQILQCFCNKSMVLNQGKCSFFGDLQNGIHFYQNGQLSTTSPTRGEAWKETDKP